MQSSPKEGSVGGRQDWKRVSGVLCDRKMSVKIKGKAKEQVVRSALVHMPDIVESAASRKRNWKLQKCTC